MVEIVNGEGYRARLRGSTIHYRVGWPERSVSLDYLESERTLEISIYAPHAANTHGIPPSPRRHQRTIPINCKRVVFRRTRNPHPNVTPPTQDFGTPVPASDLSPPSEFASFYRDPLLEFS